MRPQRSWALWLAGAVLLLAIGALTALSARQDTRSGLPTLSGHSSAPGGALALFRWTRKLGREVDYLEYRPFRLETRDALLVSLRPFGPYKEQEVSELRRWLGAGGTLLLAVDAGSELVKQLGLSVERGQQFSRAVPGQPTLVGPPVAEVVAPSTASVSADRGVPVLVTPDSGQRVALVRRAIGQGSVWLFTMPASLSNAHLERADNWKLYLNLLRDARPGRVLFDEYHHGRPEVVSLRALVLRERWGWALMYASLLVLVFLGFRGQRFGRPLQPSGYPSRSAGEYVRSLGSLLHSTRQVEYLRQHYADRLSRDLRTAVGLPPDAPLEALQQTDSPPGASMARAVAGIRELREGHPDERRMLGLVRAVESELEPMKRRSRW
ncbi:MAG: DUF4350 domain-containing protein [Chloroflexota bacterium]|nr:DUF4350 domain-containing protein [Chloroflexota bacterium]